ncbi:hypothetical protein Taro_026108 [Colocasia esculenta]|uniref:Uncharacterized protein n=1 Tax=Colocasia esculenta TaxID=4460 RepID=A0A843V5D6_COLES|nr:hypothetical protein [Colocasia esculenta]
MTMKFKRKSKSMMGMRPSDERSNYESIYKNPFLVRRHSSSPSSRLHYSSSPADVFKATSRTPFFSEVRAPEEAQLTPEQLQRLASAKISICPWKVVDFSHLSGSLSWVEETLEAMGWSKLCQLSEPTIENALKAFYVTLQVSSENSISGYVKGTKITVSEELLEEILDCPNSGHKLSETVSFDKQKLGIIGSLATVSKKGLLKEQEPQAVTPQLAIVEFQQKVEQQQESVLEEPPAAAAVEKVEQQQESQQESRLKRPFESLEDDSKSKVKIFKRKARRKLLKNGEPVFKSLTPPMPTSSFPTSTDDPLSKPEQTTTSQPIAPPAPTSSTTELPPPSTSSDPPPPTSIPKDQPLAIEKAFIFKRAEVERQPSKTSSSFLLCFAESKRFSLDQWATAYPVDHAACEKMKLSPYEYLSKSYKDLRKNIGPKWEQRYLVFYLAKEVAVSRGLHWNITVHEFLHLAASRKFVHLKHLLGRRNYYNKLTWYHKCHIKSHRKLPSISPTYNIDCSLFDNFFYENEEKLWDHLKPYLDQILGSLEGLV